MFNVKEICYKYKKTRNFFLVEFFIMAGVAGFEPTHNGVKVRCLTAWRHPKKMVGIARFELAAPCSQGRCATGLRYIPTYILIPRYYSPFFLFCQAIFYTFTIKSNSFKVFSNSSTFSFETFFVFSLMNSKYFSTFSLSFNTI